MQSRNHTHHAQRAPQAPMQSCNHAIMQSCNHAIMQSCNHAIMQSCNHAIMQSCNHAHKKQPNKMQLSQLQVSLETYAKEKRVHAFLESMDTEILERYHDSERVI
jgi:hypothetical protein